MENFIFCAVRIIKLCFLIVLILKIIISLFKLIHTFIEIFGSSSARVLSPLTTIAFFKILFIWPYIFRTRLSYSSSILETCSELGLGPLKASLVGSFAKIFGSFTCYLLPQRVIVVTYFKGSVIHI